MSPTQPATPSDALFAAEPQALLALADGTLFRGRAIGATDMRSAKSCSTRR